MEGIHAIPDSVQWTRWMICQIGPSHGWIRANLQYNSFAALDTKITFAGFYIRLYDDPGWTERRNKICKIPLALKIYMHLAFPLCLPVLHLSQSAKWKLCVWETTFCKCVREPLLNYGVLEASVALNNTTVLRTLRRVNPTWTYPAFPVVLRMCFPYCLSCVSVEPRQTVSIWQCCGRWEMVKPGVNHQLIAVAAIVVMQCSENTVVKWSPVVKNRIWGMLGHCMMKSILLETIVSLHRENSILHRNYCCWQINRFQKLPFKVSK